MKLETIAQQLGVRLAQEDGAMEVVHIASIENADERSITFLSSPRFAAAAHASKARAIIVKKGFTVPGKINLEVNDPYLAYARVALLFEGGHPLRGTGIHPTALVHAGATVDPGAAIGAYTVIEEGCVIGPQTIIDSLCCIGKSTRIGAQCRIDARVVVRHRCTIGDRVIIQSGAVIGSEGFGNALQENGAWLRIPCFGGVVIEDDVEIGANTTIDRGNFSLTIIHKGARIDNLVQVAHNVEIGDHTAIAAQVGISGSVRIGRHCFIGGQAGFTGHQEIGDGVQIGAQAGVIAQHIPNGSKITGSPTRDILKMRRIDACLNQLPDVIKELKRIREEVGFLKKQKER